MVDSYQAVYDAVRSRIGPCDPDGILRDACHFDASFAIEGVKSEAIYAIENIRQEMVSPSAIYRPRISIDGNKWCALYGDNLQEGVAGFGDSPVLAMADFDRAWNAKLGTAA